MGVFGTGASARGEALTPDLSQTGEGVIAFLGQVPVNVRGEVRAGEYIIPSGLSDGTAVAAGLEDLNRLGNAMVIGQALESSEAPGVKQVRTLVGLSANQRLQSGLFSKIQNQTEKIEELDRRLAAAEAKANEVEEMNRRLARLEGIIQKPSSEQTAESVTETAGAWPASLRENGGGR